MGPWHWNEGCECMDLPLPSVPLLRGWGSPECHPQAPFLEFSAVSSCRGSDALAVIQRRWAPTLSLQTPSLSFEHLYWMFLGNLKTGMYTQLPPNLSTRQVLERCLWNKTETRNAHLHWFSRSFLQNTFVALLCDTVVGWTGVSRKDVPSKPVHGTLFGKRVFEDVIRLKISRWDHPGLGLAPRPGTGVLVRGRKEDDMQRYREEGHVKRKAKTGVMWSQAVECLTRDTESGTGPGETL